MKEIETKMNRNLWVVLALFAAFLFCVEFSIKELRFVIFPRYPYYEVAALARELGTEIDDKRIFPRSYFEDILAEGHSMQEVHEIVRGYESVYSCGQSEIYYFYSKQEHHALRMMVVYEDGNFERVLGEDWGSQPFDVSLCGEGRIGE